MGSHHSNTGSQVLFEIDRTAPRGRHRVEPSGPGVGVKAATVAAATGAMVVGAVQFGAGTAAAAPVHDHSIDHDHAHDVIPGVHTAEAQHQAPAPGPLDFLNQVLPDGLPAGILPDGFQVPELGLGAEVGQQLQQWVDQASTVNPFKQHTVSPVSGTLTSNFGQRWGTHHGGIDIAAPIGTPIYSAANGEVIDAGAASGFGQWVRVLHDDGTITVYGHVDTYQVHVGQRVSAGEQIATVGNRGFSTGPHLHFEVHDPAGNKVDPAQWLVENGAHVTWSNSSSKV
ncbi:MAG: M23 family metallopeptidase [Rhodococcus sp.]|nr:M23 family metallopeptidase [Rhodococcus sp. (in: high G+C Gram-positive bacteria)]